MTNIIPPLVGALRKTQTYVFTINGISKRLRPLRWDELVSLGDFVMNDHRSFELWEGPSGFQANAFVKPIYRHDKSRSSTAGESE